jgi:allantoicase
MIDSAQDKALAKLVNLASPQLGVEVPQASDEFFAAKERLIEDGAPVFYPGRFDGHGKWMDGWETRRRRGPGHDWCLIRLGIPGVLSAIEVDTRHFTGNFPPAASMDTAHFRGNYPDRVSVDAGLMAKLPDEVLTGQSMFWPSLLPEQKLEADRNHVFGPEFLAKSGIVTHVRVNIHPDGGLSRFRVFGRSA